MVAMSTTAKLKRSDTGAKSNKSITHISSCTELHYRITEIWLTFPTVAQGHDGIRSRADIIHLPSSSPQFVTSCHQNNGLDKLPHQTSENNKYRTKPNTGRIPC